MFDILFWVTKAFLLSLTDLKSKFSTNPDAKDSGTSSLSKGVMAHDFNYLGT